MKKSTDMGHVRVLLLKIIIKQVNENRNYWARKYEKRLS